MTLKVRIIPCLDVKDGRVVKGVQFEDLMDAGDPVEQARFYDTEGADELCFLDISASHEGRSTLYEIVSKTAEVCFMPLTVGGGVRSVEDFRALLLAGADKVAVNTAAVMDPDLITRAALQVGSQCVVVAIDARRTSQSPAKWEIYTHGGRNPTGVDAVEFAQVAAKNGAGELLITSMDKDGTKSGYDLELLRTISDLVDIPIIASGGVGTLQHMVEGITIGKANAVLAASIFHYGTYSLEQARKALKEAGLEVRKGVRGE